MKTATSGWHHEQIRDSIHSGQTPIHLVNSTTCMGCVRLTSDTHRQRRAARPEWLLLVQGRRLVAFDVQGFALNEADGRSGTEGFTAVPAAARVSRKKFAFVIAQGRERLVSAVFA